MTDRENGECPAARYLRRPPESLVVNGYRGWLTAVTRRDGGPLNDVWAHFLDVLGHDVGRQAMEGLETLIRELGVCAACPLRFAHPKAQHLCRDECLVLGLVAGLQSGDDDAAFESAVALTCSAQSLRLLYFSSGFAMTLKAAGQQLLPIHAHVIREIVAASSSGAGQTVH